MSNEEFEFILAALEFIAIYGQRFLTLYHFDLRTGSWTARKKALLCLMKKNNSNAQVLPLDNGIKSLNMDATEFNEHPNSQAKHNGMVNKFASYLETAMEIAHLLPKFPPERRVQEDIDLSFLQFRI